MGMVNQQGPDGSLTYSQSGSHSWRDPSTGQYYTVPQYTATTTLSPEAQAIRDQTNQADLNLATLASNQSGRADDLLSSPMSLNGLPAAADRSGMAPVNYSAGPNAPQYSTQGTAMPQVTDLATGYENDFGAQKDEVQKALMGQINEQRDRDMEGLRTQLANQGVGIGTEAYSRAVDDFNRSNDNARTQALLAAGQEQSRLVNLARDEATFGNTATNQNNQNQMALYSLGEDQRRYGDAMKGQSFSDQMALTGREDANQNANFNQQQVIAEGQDNSRSRAMQEQFALRNQPINEITALLSGSQVSTPQFSMTQPSQIPTTDYAGLMQQGYANDIANYQNKMAPWNQAVGGLFNLGSAALIGG